MLLVKENENISHKGWTKGVDSFYRLSLKGKEPDKLLEVMRKVIFKAAICCEIRWPTPRARSATLEILEQKEEDK